MGREDQIISERLRKLAELRKQKINPYPYKYDKKDSTKDIHEKNNSLKPEAFSKQKAKTAGRITSKRSLGKITFATLEDEQGKIQIVFQEGKTLDEVKELFDKYVDIGDFIGAEGKIFRTKRGELSILAEAIAILAKSLKPLPEKWHGLQDKEERYRKRYLDLIMDPDVRGTFLKREKILNEMRLFLTNKGFHEVETPYLQTIYGGANAKPFITHLNALDLKLYLAISPELYLKRLIVGGFEKVFTISRNFRNEGIDRWHNPEFSMLELYQAYADYNDMMEVFEQMYEHIAKKVNGTTKVKFRGKEIDFKAPWKKLTMAEAIKKYAKIEINKSSQAELEKIIAKNKIEYDGDSWGWAVQAIFEHFCEDKIEQPTFILDHPLETTPLCKIHRTDKLCRLIERFEPFCMGAELGNAYSELNDPQIQKKLFEEQRKLQEKGNEEAHPMDEDFVESLEIGMPPTGGLGLGIDRMVMLLTGQDSIRDVIFFPFMKPSQEKNKGGSKSG